MPQLSMCCSSANSSQQTFMLFWLGGREALKRFDPLSKNIFGAATFARIERLDLALTVFLSPSILKPSGHVHPEGFIYWHRCNRYPISDLDGIVFSRARLISLSEYLVRSSSATGFKSNNNNKRAPFDLSPWRRQTLSSFHQQSVAVQ